MHRKLWVVWNLLFFVATMSPAQREKSAAIYSIPITFEANRGQAPVNVGFVFHREGMVAELLANEAGVVISGRDRRSTVQLLFGGRNAEPKGQDELHGYANYFIGNDSRKWMTRVPMYSRVSYRDVYPGINIEFYGNGTKLEHDFIINPGADPKQIVLRINGESNLHLQDGDLVGTSEGAQIQVRKPVAYQVSNGVRLAVKAEMVLDKNRTVRFRVGKFNHSLPLIVDPVLVFSSYLGGTGSDIPTGVATDAVGNVLVTGFTSSTDFPIQNPEQAAMAGCNQGGGCQNAYITKFDPTGATLIYSTYLGGSTGNIAAAIAVDGSGNAIIAGITASPDFPRAGALTGSSPNCSLTDACAFVASLTPDGSTLNYSGPIGGKPAPNSANGGTPYGQGLALVADGAGNAYVTGTTLDPNFLVTPGTLATSFVGYPYFEMFVLKVDPTGAVLYSTPVPGTATNVPGTTTNEFGPAAIHVDAAGNATIVGTAGPGLPTTAGVVAGQIPSGTVNPGTPTAGFVLQLNTTASAINYASYLPGADYANAFTVDGSGNLWIAGATLESDLPVSATAYMKTPTPAKYSTPESGYVLELSPGAKSVLGATYLNGPTNLGAIALDSHGNVFVGGMTGAQDFPMRNPLATQWESQISSADMVLAALSPDLSTLQFGSYLNPQDPVYGGSNFAGLAVDATDHLVVVGSTVVTDFMTTPGSFELRLPPPTSSSNTPEHTFVAKLNMSASAPGMCPDTLGVNFGNVNVSSSAYQTVRVADCGDVALTINSITSTDPTVTGSQICQSILPGTACPVMLTYTPVASSDVQGSVILAGNTQTPLTISFTGRGAHLLTFSPALSGSTSATVSSGSTATYNLLLTAGQQLSGSFGLICSGAPQYATCNVSPPTLNLAAGQAESLMVTVSTETTSQTAQRNGFGGSLKGMELLSLAGLILLGRTRKGRGIKMLAACAVALALTSSLASCGGGGGGGMQINKTPAGTYSLAIKAQGSGVTATQSLTLIVQ